MMDIKFDLDKIYDVLINEGGFTIDAKTMNIVNKTRGFAVAVNKRYETGFPSIVFTQAPQIGKRLLNQILSIYYLGWLRGVRGCIRGAVYIGAWYHDARYYIDFSEFELDRDIAIHKGLWRGQKAIYDLYKGEEIRINRQTQKTRYNTSAPR